MKLSDWGSIPEYTLAEGETLGRVTEEQRTNYTVVTEQGPLTAQLSGKLLHPQVDRLDRPVVGDWVAVRALWSEGKAVVQRVLPRKSLLKRKAAGETEAIQPLAANVDLTFIVTSMNRDFNAKRLDRYLTIAHGSGSRAAILLTKSDLEPGSAALAEDLAAKHGVPCLALSALMGEGLEPLKELLKPKETVVFVGSSGVGKSTLVNALLGREEQATSAVREDDDRGRHTTTSRRLIPAAGNCLLIDTPGLREIQLDASQEEGLEESFAGVEELALSCKFTNCAHESEPGCGVKAALKSGALTDEQYQSYLKLKRELRAQARKTDKALASEDKKKWKAIGKIGRERMKHKRGED
jgi:ribosome biogenesis GTPase